MEIIAKNAWTCHLDIDKDELDKPTLNTDLKVNGDIKNFFNKQKVSNTILRKTVSDGYPLTSLC